MIGNKAVRQTLTVARRDFIATVFTPTFLIFLAAPLIMLTFSLVGGLGARSMAINSTDKMRLVAVADTATWTKLEAAEKSLRPMLARDEVLPKLIRIAPNADQANQAREAMERNDVEVAASISGPLATPTILHRADSPRFARYLSVLADTALRIDRSGGIGPLSQPTIRQIKSSADSFSISGGNKAAGLTVFGLFILTLMLAGQAVGTMAEERSNKVIEILAAAVPLESVFLGKLIGMFGVALLFVAFWGTIVVNVGQLLPANFARAFSEVGPAVGPWFAPIFLAYFTTAYLLLGAVFLGIGAQASTPREIQMLSLPITIFQVAMFGLSQAAASQPDSTLTRFAEIFPFSSPFAMAARAANRPELWPHLLAIGWQLAWVSVTIWIGARLFRRGVLQSGSPAFWKRGRSKAAGVTN